MYLLDIQKLLTSEKYPSGVSSRQRVLELEEEQERMMGNGYSYFDNGNSSGSEQSSISNGVIPRKKIGKRLILHEAD